jgi:hypothetical protein
MDKQLVGRIQTKLDQGEELTEDEVLALHTQDDSDEIDEEAYRAWVERSAG